MERKTLDSVIKTEVRGNQVNEMPICEKPPKTREGHGAGETGPKKKYDAVSRNGDTLELSENGKKMAGHPGMGGSSLSGKKIISVAGKKLSETVLAGFSEAELKRLCANNEITRQQYVRIMKRKKMK